LSSTSRWPTSSIADTKGLDTRFNSINGK
jgi:hypothetical protein